MLFQTPIISCLDYRGPPLTRHPWYMLASSSILLPRTGRVSFLKYKAAHVTATDWKHSTYSFPWYRGPPASCVPCSLSASLIEHLSASSDARNFSTSGSSHMLLLLPRTFFLCFHMPDSLSFKPNFSLFPQIGLLQPTPVPLVLSLLASGSVLLWHFYHQPGFCSYFSCLFV